MTRNQEIATSLGTLTLYLLSLALLLSTLFNLINYYWVCWAHVNKIMEYLTFWTPNLGRLEHNKHTGPKQLVQSHLSKVVSVYLWFKALFSENRFNCRTWSKYFVMHASIFVDEASKLNSYEQTEPKHRAVMMSCFSGISTDNQKQKMNISISNISNITNVSYLYNYLIANVTLTT